MTPHTWIHLRGQEVFVHAFALALYHHLLLLGSILFVFLTSELSSDYRGSD